ncbi:glycosyl transferase [Sulfolobales archaeon HS-7]|nr:glycosyl transferase [Sulfolobales archaeon HS-7]
MDLLLVNHRDPYHPQAGGAEEVLYQIAIRLSQRHKVTWLSEKVKGRPSVEVIKGVTIIRRGGKLTLHLKSPFEARKHDVVIDSVAHAVPFMSYLTNRRSVALIHHVHQDVLNYELSFPLSYAVKTAERMVRNYKYLIAVSNTTKRELMRRFSVEESRISVIHNGVDHEKYKPGEKSEKPLILWIGRMKRYKNPLDAVEIFKRLRTKADMIIAGGGELSEEVKRACDEKGIQFLGRVSEEVKVKLYQRAWVLLSTSFVEGWGMTVVEANACGTPAVAYNTGSMPEIIKDGKNGFTVKYKDFDEAAKAVEYVLEDGNKTFSKSSVEESNKYNWEKTADEYERFLRNLP